MADPISIAKSVLVSIKATYDGLKLIAEAEKQLSEAELQLKYAELLRKLAGAEREVASLEGAVADLARLLEFSGNMVFEAPFYWNGEGGGKEGPYCSRCWDAETKAVHLHKTDPLGYWTCPKCATGHKEAGYDQALERNDSRGEDWWRGGRQVAESVISNSICIAREQEIRQEDEAPTLFGREICVYPLRSNAPAKDNALIQTQRSC